MQNFNDDDVKKMLEQLKEHADKKTEEEIKPQTTDNSPHSDDDIKNMLKKHFSAEANDTFAMSEDYSFDTVDFGRVDDEVITGEIKAEQPVEEAVEETIEEPIEETIEETIEEPIEETVEETIEEPIEETIEETIEEPIEETIEEPIEEPIEGTIEESIEETIEEPIEEPTPEPEPEPVIEEEPISEESINYDEVLEGQQGTVFNNFVEDFTGDLDDVVFEAEITESRAPDKQYTIFEDWEKLMKDKNYATAEDGIIPPTNEELENSIEIAKRAKANTDYFNPVSATEELDAVDIALMVALGGEGELNQTVGFEKIRQAVNDPESSGEEKLSKKSIYGFSGEEYKSHAQDATIKKKYKKDKIRTIIQLILSIVLTAVLIGYELVGWMGMDLPGIFSINNHWDIHILAAMQLLFLCAAVSYNKFIKLFKNMFDFSSISFFSAVIVLLLNVYNDGLIITMLYVDPSITFHSLSAILFVISLIYDLFEISQQSGVFKIVSENDKKIVLEPYGKLHVGDDDGAEHSEIIDKDSYCISKVTSVDKFFDRMSRPTRNTLELFIPIILSMSVALCVMLVLVLMLNDFPTITTSTLIAFSFALICASVFEGEFAYFVVYKALKKYKTGIIGKASVSEYGKCNIVYFDDYNVFNKKSVRTKGLKLYDNNEIYRVLYHTQAVFSKIGGPLKGVFEFATSEMVHSKSVDIKEISKEGIVAVVDGRTSVLIGTGSFMKSRGIHPKYTSADLKSEERGDESIMFIALNGTLGAKLYVTYQFSAEFEKLARKLTAKGVGIGIRSSDPNINTKWANRYGDVKKFHISVVRPTLKDLKPREKSIDGGVVSAKNVRALSEALLMCIKLYGFEALVAKIRTASIVLMGILTFGMVVFSGVNIISVLSLSLACALCASIMMLLSHFYIRH